MMKRLLGSGNTSVGLDADHTPDRRSMGHRRSEPYSGFLHVSNRATAEIRLFTQNDVK